MYYNTELYHHGILGQKWGVRRYQNSDGTLTAAGQKRYSSGSSETKKPSGTIVERGDKAKITDLVKSTTNSQRKQMSDEELQSRIKRLQMEKNLKDLEKQTKNDGQTLVNEIIKDVGKKTVTTAVSGAVLYGVKVAISGQFNAGELGDAVFRGGAKKK